MRLGTIVSLLRIIIVKYCILNSRGYRVTDYKSLCRVVELGSPIRVEKHKT